MNRRTICLLLTSASVVSLIPMAADAKAAAGNRAAAQADPSATAQAAPAAPSDAAIGDIVVTAQRRSSSVQNTPLAVTAVDGQTLATRQIASLQDLAPNLPSVSINPTLGNGRIAIRGVGLDTTQTGGEGRVAFHVDGVYFSRPSSTLSSQFDIDRVEVVRGAQGTLYGRNATAGAINIITPDPTNVFGGYARVTVGNYDLVHTEAAVNIPLDADGGIRIAGQTTDRTGYGRNIVTNASINNTHSKSARVTIKQKLGDAVTVRLSADYHHEHDSDYAFYYLGAGNSLITPLAIRNGAVVASGYDTAADFQQANRRTYYGGSLATTIALGGPTLTSITGYRHSDSTFSADADGTSFNAGVSNQFELGHQFSEELRLAGDYGRADYILGGYYFNEFINGHNEFSPLNQLVSATGTNQQVVGFSAGGTQRTMAYAAFGEIHFDLTPTLRLVAGGRYSFERKHAIEYTVTNLTTPYVPGYVFVPTRTSDQEQSWSSFTPRAGIEFKPRPGLLLYATYSQGFKSGGFALGALSAPVQPEKLIDYEVGIKADFFDHRLRTNISAFHYDYSNLQISKVVTGGTQLVNAAKAKLSGFEAEVTAIPVRGLQFDMTAAYLDSKYTDFQTSDPARPTLGVIDLSGNELSQAAPYTMNFGAQYQWHAGFGKLTLRGEANMSGRTYFNPFNRPELSQPAFSKFNAFLNIESDDGHWTGSVFVRNIGNRRTLTFAYTSNPLFGTPIIGAYAPPRTFGAQIGYKF